jgi:hypothetical protein
MAGTLKHLYRAIVDDRVRDAMWALRSRGDASVLSAVVRGMFGWPHAAGTAREHLDATMAWLCAAQDAVAGGGVSAFYDVRAGTWGPPYPETTGYIIPTFHEVARLTGDAGLAARADRMAGWLLTLQLPDGAFPIGPLWPDWARDAIVFDTGQILHGLVRTYEERRDARVLEAASRAGDWLARIQENDGAWRRHESDEKEKTYNVRTAWALLRLHAVSGSDRHRDAAVKNLQRALSVQAPDGWYASMEFKAGTDPLTHTIAYTIEGVLESGILLGDDRLIASARKAADAMLEAQREAGGILRGRYAPGWTSTHTWTCLTGTAQMAMVWLTLHGITKDPRYVDAAQVASRHVRERQVRGSALAGVAGGIAGSWPIYGEYEPYRHLNWAAKFFVDGLLLELRLGAVQAR